MSEQRMVAQANHQTIRLSKGKHATAGEGACVMELASMLAGEPFSDRPASVCPVIGGFLRAYNDRIDDDRRQDLYRYASEVVGSFLRTYNDLVDDDRRQDLYRYAALIVGTRADRDVEQARLAMCREWAYGRRREWHRRGLRRLWPFGWGVAKTATPPVLAGRLAARLAEDAGDRHHREALAFVARLITAGQPNLGSAEQAPGLEPTPVFPMAD